MFTVLYFHSKDLFCEFLQGRVRSVEQAPVRFVPGGVSDLLPRVIQEQDLGMVEEECVKENSRERKWMFLKCGLGRMLGLTSACVMNKLHHHAHLKCC